MKDEVAEFAGGLNEVSWITLATTNGTFCPLVSHSLCRDPDRKMFLRRVFSPFKDFFF